MALSGWSGILLCIVILCLHLELNQTPAKPLGNTDCNCVGSTDCCGQYDKKQQNSSQYDKKQKKSSLYDRKHKKSSQYDKKQNKSYKQEVSCFPADAKVTVSTDEGLKIIEMKQLAIGDLVLSYNVSSGMKEFSKVITFLDYKPNMLTNYSVLYFENGNTLTLSSDHLLFKVERQEADDNAKLELVARLARHIKKGDDLFYADNSRRGSEIARVGDIQKTRKLGAFSPLTNSGNLFVDDVLVSSYAMFEDQNLVHYMFEPLRRKLLLVPETKPKQGIHWYAKWLYKFAKGYELVDFNVNKK